MHPPVNAEIYQDIIAACGKDFAFSYLLKAGQRGSVVYPFTVTAWERLMGNAGAREVFRRRRVTLEKPQPYHEGRRFMGDTERAEASTGYDQRAA